METKQITDIRIVKALYRTRLRRDFDPLEIRPWSQIQNLWDRDEYKCYCLAETEEIRGYAFFAGRSSAYLLDYLAIEENHRGGGLGSVFLKQLSDHFREAEYILVEVEDPSAASGGEDRLMRERRLQFYLRNGYKKTDVTARVFGVDFLILELPTGKEHPAAELLEVYTEIYRNFFPLLFFKTQFKASIGK